MLDGGSNHDGLDLLEAHLRVVTPGNVRIALLAEPIRIDRTPAGFHLACRRPVRQGAATHPDVRGRLTDLQAPLERWTRIPPGLSTKAPVYATTTLPNLARFRCTQGRVTRAVEFMCPGTFEPVAGYRAGGPRGLHPGEWTADTRHGVGPGRQPRHGRLAGLFPTLRIPPTLS